MVCFRSLIPVEQHIEMTKSVNPIESCSKPKQINQFRKRNSSSSNQLNIPACSQSSSAVIDVIIMIAVICASGFLLYPYAKILAHKTLEFTKEVMDVMIKEIMHAPLVYGCLALSILFAVTAAVVVTVCADRRCGKEGCPGLRMATEFEIQLETEDYVRNSDITAKSVIRKGLFELQCDRLRKLEEELRKIAPRNGRAVLVHRARCGCCAGRMEVPGSRNLGKGLASSRRTFSRWSSIDSVPDAYIMPEVVVFESHPCNVSAEVSRPRLGAMNTSRQVLASKCLDACAINGGRRRRSSQCLGSAPLRPLLSAVIHATAWAAACDQSPMDAANSTVRTPEAESETPTRIQPAKTSPFTTANGVLKRRAPPGLHPPGVVAFRECLKNHAASIGGYAVDGCGDFLPSAGANPADPASLKCAACGCHRNFHRRETDEARSVAALEYRSHHRHHPPAPPPAGGGDSGSSPNNSPSPPPISSSYYPSAPHMLLALSHGASAPHPESNAPIPAAIHAGSAPRSNSGSRKRFRTKFTQNQKDKMLELAEKVDWKMQKKDEDLISEFCTEIGVERGVFKVWMHNNKNTLGKKENQPQPPSSSAAGEPSHHLENEEMKENTESGQNLGTNGSSSSS